MPSHTSTQDLSTIVDRACYQQRNSNVFPSLSSLEWFIRVNQTELVEHGALVRLTNRIMIDESRFGAAARRIGERLAKAYAP